MSSMVKSTRPRRIFYAKDVNMNYSFDSLHKMANKLLGAEIEVGDIIVCDNAKGDKRKMLQMTKDGYMIYYGRLAESKFRPLLENNGMIRKQQSIRGPVLG